MISIARATPASCRCFGETVAAPFGLHHLARNVVLTAVAGIGAYASLGDPAVTTRTVVLAVPLSMVSALIVVRLDDLAVLFAPVTPAGSSVHRDTAQRAGPSGS
ncbi:hypothetical protein NKG94_52035 [Micromonospora sp. M12]